MTDKVEETGPARYHRLKAEAKELGINTEGLKADQLEEAIAAKSTVDGPTGISLEDAKNIEARLRFEEETREKIRGERQRVVDCAQIRAEAAAQCVVIDLPENPTEMELATARQKLSIEKKMVKPSPETLAIEAGKRGYYIFTNREQDDASHTANLGGKYIIHLIPDQVHVLTDFHIRRWRQCAVTPEYGRVPTGVIAGDATVGQAVEKCQRTGSKPRFAFEHLGEAPVDAPFGLVTDPKVLKEVLQTA